jgi:hypothetical protein
MKIITTIAGLETEYRTWDISHSLRIQLRAGSLYVGAGSQGKEE